MFLDRSFVFVQEEYKRTPILVPGQYFYVDASDMIAEIKNKAKTDNDDVIEIVPTPTPFIPVDMDVVMDNGGLQKISAAYRKAKDINDDVVGWMYLPDTVINYPVLFYSGDNNYYLAKDLEKKKSSAGSIFMDAFSDGDWGIINLLHGHSMRNKTMFGMVLSYKDQAWANEHNFVYVWDGATTRTYQLFSVIIVDGNDSSDRVPIRYSSVVGRVSHLDTIKSRSIVETVGIHTYDDILVLNTCSYEYNNAHLIVYFSRVLV
jgi:sortase B